MQGCQDVSLQNKVAKSKGRFRIVDEDCGKEAECNSHGVYCFSTVFALLHGESGVDSRLLLFPDKFFCTLVLQAIEHPHPGHCLKEQGELDLTPQHPHPILTTTVTALLFHSVAFETWKPKRVAFTFYITWNCANGTNGTARLMKIPRGKEGAERLELALRPTPRERDPGEEIR